MVKVRRWCRRLGDAADQPPEVQRISALNNDDLLDWAISIADHCQRGADFYPRSEARAAWQRAIHDGGLGNKRPRRDPNVVPDCTRRLRQLQGLVSQRRY
jgi:hypothetical protein